MPSEHDHIGPNKVVTNWGRATTTAARERVARALVEKGLTLVALGRAEEALVVYDVVVVRFGSVPGPALRHWVCKALASKGAALGGLGRFGEAAVAYGKVLAIGDDVAHFGRYCSSRGRV